MNIFFAIQELRQQYPWLIPYDWDLLVSEAHDHVDNEHFHEIKSFLIECLKRVSFKSAAGYTFQTVMAIFESQLETRWKGLVHVVDNGHGREEILFERYGLRISIAVSYNAMEITSVEFKRI